MVSQPCESAHNVWAVGDGGTILNWNGNAWKLVPYPYVASLHGVWGIDRNSIWAVDYGLTIGKWNEIEWEEQQNQPAFGYGFYGIWGSDENHIWAIGERNTIFKGGVGGWPWPSRGTDTNTLTGVWGSSASDIWVVGASGTILRRKQ